MRTSKASQIVIRPATAMDSVNIVRLIRDGWKETPLVEHSDFDEQAMLEYVTKALARCFALVADLHGRLLGSIALVPIRMPWTEKPVMAEAWVAVHAQFRHRGVPEQLLKPTVEFLDRNQWTVMFGTNAIVPSVLNEFFLPRLGFEPMRSTYVRHPDQATAEVGAVAK